MGGGLTRWGQMAGIKRTGPRAFAWVGKRSPRHGHERICWGVCTRGLQEEAEAHKARRCHVVKSLMHD